MMKRVAKLAPPLRVCVRIILSPRWGCLISQIYPRLTLWAVFLRRSAAMNRCRWTNATAKFEFSHAFLGAAFGAQPDCLRCPTSASSLYLR
jgi:hypothetical protein